MTDPELIVFLAEKGMGWPVFETSVHRTGTRPLPHGWWHGDRFMVFMGGSGPDSNREWNPLKNDADVDELIVATSRFAEQIPGAARFGSRDICTAIAALLKEEHAPDSDSGP